MVISKNARNWAILVILSAILVGNLYRIYREENPVRVVTAESRVHQAVQSGDVDGLRKALAGVDKINNVHSLIVEAMNKNHLDCVELLLKSRPKQADNPWQPSLVYLAAEKGKTECLSLFLKAGEKITAVNHMSPIHVAANGDTVKLLLAAGADVNSMDLNGERPLHSAARKHNVSALKALLAAGAGVNELNRSGTAALQGIVNPWQISGLPMYEPEENFQQRVDCIRLLIAAGAAVDALNPAGRTVLHEAVIRNRADLFRVLLEQGASLKLLTREGKNVVQLAVQSGKGEILQYLIDKGSMREAVVTKEIMQQAFQYRNEPAVLILLKNGLQADASDSWLPLAAQANMLTAATELLKNGASPDAIDLKGRRALLQAQSGAMTRLLLQAGAKLDSVNSAGQNSLHRAVLMGDLDIVATVLAAGADIKAKDLEGNQPVHLLALSSHPSEALLAALVKAGADPSAVNGRGQSPLQLAISKGSSAATEALMAAGVKINPQASGESVLIGALRQRNEVLALTLMKNGADVSGSNILGELPLNLAAGLGLAEVTQRLIQLGADVNAADKFGDHPLDAALKFKTGSPELPRRVPKPVDPLNQVEARRTSWGQEMNLPAGIEDIKAQDEILQLLLKAGAKVNQRNRERSLPIHVAAQIRREGPLRLLLEAGAQVDQPNGSGDSPLHLALKSGCVASVQQLLAVKAKVDEVDALGASPLHLACASAHEAAGRALLAAGAKIDLVDATGNQPLHLAASRGSLALVQLLLEAGSDPLVLGQDGRTAARMASPQNRQLVELLATAEIQSRKKLLEQRRQATQPKP